MTLGRGDPLEQEENHRNEKNGYLQRGILGKEQKTVRSYKLYHCFWLKNNLFFLIELLGMKYISF